MNSYFKCGVVSALRDDFPHRQPGAARFGGRFLCHAAIVRRKWGKDK